MQNLISQTFAVTAQKPTVSVDHIDNYYITEASGIMPSVNDSRWTLVPDGQQVPVPTASAPYLWHKYITYLTDGTALDPIVEFAGSLGQNGFDYDLVPSNSAIIKDTSDNLTPANVTCSLIKRNADGSAETQSTVPSGYSVVVYRDNTPSPYTLGANVPTSGITSVITFVLKYGSIEVERHDIRVIAEGAEGLTGRGIQSQDTRFKATATNSQPATPTNDTTWNTWSALSSAGYSQDTPYLWKCIRTVYRNGNGTTDTEYLVEGPTVWGQNGADAIFIDLDNEMDAIPCDSTGKVTSRTVLTSYARLYRGSAIINTDLTAPVAANCKLGSVTPTVTSQADGSYKLEWVFAVNTQLSVDRITANVAIGYGGKSYAELFTANVVKSGSPGVSPAIYQLLLSQNEASFARNSSNQLTPASISIRCGYTKNYNGTIDKHVGSQALDLQNIDSKYNIFYRPIASNGNPGSWAWMKDLSSANFYLVIPNSTTNIAYEFVLSTASGTASIEESNIFDRETLPINKDGLNGAPGESALIIDLTNEIDAFGTKADGKITASVSRETRASMFYGITPLTATYQSTKTYEDGTNCGNEVDVVIDSETGLVTVTMNNTNFVYNKTIFIDITGTASGYTDKPKTARFTIQPQAAGSDGKTPIIYQLMPSPSQLSFARNSDGTLNMANNVITGYVKKIEDEDTTILSSLSGYRIYYGYGNPTTPSNYISVGGTITVSASNAASYASLVLELWKMNGTTKQKRLDRETIPINKEGQKGDPGDPGDDGITPFIIDIDNEMTSVPVSQEGAVIAATTLEFNLAAYYGQTNVINDCTVECVSGSDQQVTVDVTTNKAKPKIVIAQGFTPPTMIELCFRVTHANYGSRDAVFSIAFVKAGGQGLNAILYELLPSLSQIAVGRTDNGAYNPANVALTCGYTKTDGPNTTSVADCTSSFDGYEIYFRRFLRSSNAWQTTYYKYRTYKSYLASIVVATYSKVQFIICKNTSGTITNTTLDDVNVTGLIDRETVSIVADGQKGDKGDNAFILDLDNEMAAIPVNQSGAVEAQKQLTFGLNAYYGTTAVFNDCTVTVDGTVPSGFSVNLDDKFNPVVTISANTTPAEITELTFKAVHATYGTRYATFSVCAVKAGGNGIDAEIYQLKPYYTAIQFARDGNGNLTGGPYTLTCQIQKTKGTSVNNYDSLSGYYIYYDWDGAASPATSLPTAGRSVSTSDASSHTNIVLELWKGARNVSGSVRLDRETIPILKDGSRGGTGPDGTGIASITFHRMFTMSLDGEPLPTDSGWIASTSSSYPSESGLSETNRYLWQKKTTTYTKNDVATTYEVSLLAQFNSGLKENLLEDTSFFSEGQMEAWNVKNGTIGIGTARGHNSFGLTPDFTVELSPMLRQIVHNGSTLKKLRANTWYTLSFYAAMQAKQNLFSGTDYNGNGNTDYAIFRESYREVWLGANQSMDVEVEAYCASSNVFLRYFAWSYDTGDSTNWKNTTKVDFTETSETKKTMRVTNTASYGRLFRMRGWVYLNGTFTINGQQVVSNPTVASPLQNNSTNNPNGYNTTTYRCYIKTINVNRGCRLSTYLYRADNGAAVQHSSSAPWYVDGKKYTAADQSANANLQSGTLVAFSNDGCVHWQLSPGTVRHTVTFKTPSSLSSSTEYAVLFRMNQYSHFGWVSMPKLEENTMATEWIEHTSDRFADDMQHIFVGDWVASTQGTTSTYYHFDNGVRHVVLAKESASSTKKVYFRMKQRTTAEGYCSTTQPYSDTNHWEKASNIRFIAAEFILADQALLKFAQTNRILVYNSAGNVAAGMGGAEGGSNDYPLWVGADYANRATAAFRVSLLGKLYATGAEISGKITATQGTIGGFTIGTDSIVSTGNAVLRIGNDNFKTQFGITESSKTVQMNGSEQGVVLVNYTFSYKENNRFTLRKTTTSYYNWTNFGAANVIDLDFHSGTHSGSASNNRYGFQYAMIGNGHVIMNGIVEGAAYDRVANWSAANQIQMVQMPLYSNRIVVSTTYDNDILILPDKYSMFSALGCGFIKSATSQYFTFRLDIINTGTKNVYVAGYNSLKVGTSSNYTQPYMNTNLPYMRYRNNSYSGEKDIYVRPKNILSLMLVYDNGTYYAFIINDPN